MSTIQPDLMDQFCQSISAIEIEQRLNLDLYEYISDPILFCQLVEHDAISLVSEKEKSLAHSLFSNVPLTTAYKQVVFNGCK